MPASASFICSFSFIAANDSSKYCVFALQSGEAEYFHIASYLGARGINLLKLCMNVVGKLKIDFKNYYL